jgi:release factor glutamine methyltransferase
MTEPTQTWTSLKLIQWTAEFFEKKGIPNPRLDAELLLAHVLGCKRIDLYTSYEKTVREKDLASFKAFVERRAKREPLQQITGETEFWGLRIKVTPSVLIPRPETELLIETAIGLVASFHSPVSQKPLSNRQGEDADNGRAASERGRLSVADKTMAVSILEIGAGSGCVSIALAKQLPEAKIIATELSKEAVEVAKENVEKNGVESQVKIVLADIAPWKSFKAEGLSFDLIVSNPPYIATSELDGLQPEVSRFEPRQALDGGKDGLDIIRKILEEAPDFLKREGTLLLEIGEDQGARLRKEMPERLRWLGIKKDYAGHDRIVLFKKP